VGDAAVFPEEYVGKKRHNLLNLPFLLFWI